MEKIFSKAVSIIHTLHSDCYTGPMGFLGFQLSVSNWWFSNLKNCLIFIFLHKFFFAILIHAWSLKAGKILCQLCYFLQCEAGLKLLPSELELLVGLESGKCFILCKPFHRHSRPILVPCRIKVFCILQKLHLFSLLIASALPQNCFVYVYMLCICTRVQCMHEKYLYNFWVYSLCVLLHFHVRSFCTLYLL